MNKKVKFELKGEKELIDALRKLDSDVRYSLARRVATEAGKMVQDTAKATTMFKDITGALRDSIVVEVASGIRGSVTRIGSTIGDTEQAHGFYAFFLEYGTKRMEPHSFMRPALYDNANAIKQLFEDALRKEVEKVSAK